MIGIRFSGECPGPRESTAVRLISLNDLLGHLGVQDRPHVSTTVVSTALAAGLYIRWPLTSRLQGGESSPRDYSPQAHLPGSIRWRWPDRSQVGGGPQPLALRRRSPRKPPVPAAYALARLGHSNTELSTGDLRVRAAITVLLRVWWQIDHCEPPRNVLNVHLAGRQLDLAGYRIVLNILHAVSYAVSDETFRRSQVRHGGCKNRVRIRPSS